MPKRDLFAKLSFFIFSSDVILIIKTKNIIDSFIRKNDQFSTILYHIWKKLKNDLCIVNISFLKRGANLDLNVLFGVSAKKIHI